MAAKRYKHTTVRQWGGDDGYQWSVFVRGESSPRVTGLTRREVAFYRDAIEETQATLAAKRRGTK